jgi:hypothetical protein
VFGDGGLPRTAALSVMVRHGLFVKPIRRETEINDAELEDIVVSYP